MVKAAFAKTRPIAFMRGLTFPGGQQPVIRGEGVYLRYPRIADYPVWARLRGESREFLTPWEPVWADDELTRGAFRRRIKRYQKETRLDSAYVFFVFRAERRCADGRLHPVQCAARRHPMLHPGLLDRRTLRAPGLHVRSGARAGALHLPTLGLHRIEAACLPSNEASQSLARQGRLPPGRARARYLLINGEWRDHLLFALLAEEAQLG